MGRCKIIDCFIFYNELDLLTYRLNVLNNVVDYFVIVESTHTFTGKEKQLIFNENKHLFKEFNEKIIHIIVDDFPHKYPNINIGKNEQWRNEDYQRNAISRGIDRIPNLIQSDVLIITDVDEIPDPNTLARIKRGDIVVSINSLEMDFYYYNLNAKYRVKWTHCKIVSFQMYKNLNSDCGAIRSKNNCVPIQNGGWHLSYFGDSAFIKNKLENFSHQEYNNAEYANLSTIETRVKNFESLFINGGIHPDKIDARHNNYLPVDYDKYLKKFVLY